MLFLGALYGCLASKLRRDAGIAFYSFADSVGIEPNLNYTPYMETVLFVLWLLCLGDIDESEISGLGLCSLFRWKWSICFRREYFGI